MIRAFLTLLPAGSGRLVATHLVLTVLGTILRAAGAVLLVPLIATLFGAQPADAWPWLGALVGVTALGWIVDAAAARRAFALGFGALDSGQRTVADRISAIRRSWFTADNTATARQAIAATGPDLVGIVVHLVTPLLSAVLLPVAIAVGLVWVSWLLALAALAGVPLLLGALWLSGRLSRTADRAAADANAALTERVLEFARTQQALRAARRAEPARSLAGAAITAQHGSVLRLLLMQIPGQLLFGLTSQVALLVLAGVTVLLTAQGTLGVPAAVALIVVIVRYLEPFTIVGELSGGVEATMGALGRIRAVLQAPTDPEGAIPATVTDAPTVTLDGIRFGYGDGAPVLEDFTLRLAAGTTTAIVGPSGSGKSTVLALLAGLQHPQAGRIFVGERDVAELDAASRRALVSAVFQEPYLFDGTIEDNIAVGDPAASANAHAAAMALARVDAITDRLPEGAQTRVGEAGGTLSGGERQRVSIARALLKPAPLLLVDEATSALDAENEAAVAAALSDDPRPRTRVIVAHRLSSIQSADRVVFLEEGRIVEDGTIPELLAAGGRFAEFWAHQNAAGAWRLRAESAV